MHTGLYRNVYLGVDLSSDKMYEHAVRATERLKAKEKEKLLQFRRNRREKSQLSGIDDAKPVENSAEDQSGPMHRFKFRLRPHRGEGVEESSGDIAQKA